MTISIITPSYGQLDWLRLCVASVADQLALEAQGAESMVESQLSSAGFGAQIPISQLPAAAQSPLAIEHIIQDGGTPEIEEFARKLGEDCKSRYGGEVVSDLQVFELLHLRTASGYTLRIFKEPDAGMYDAINKGIARMSGEIWAWLNSDEQYLPGTLAYVRDWFEAHPNIEIVCGDALLTDSHGEALSYRRIVTPQWHHTRLVHLSSLSCASFYRRSVVNRFSGFDTAWRSIGDAEWVARMLKGGVRIKACGKLFSTFAFTGQNTSESPLARKESEEWKKSPDAPFQWMRLPVIWWHRIRKLLAGAYGRRSVTYGIHTNAQSDRVMHRADHLGWEWPSSLRCHRLAKEKPVFVAVLGSDLLITDYMRLSEFLLGDSDAQKEKRVKALDFANTHIVTMRRHDTRFRDLTKCIDLTAPDGMPLVWAMNAKGSGLKDRVYGPTFTREFLSKCPSNYTHFLIGGSEECGRKFRERMLELNPSLKFIGGYHGPCSADGLLENQEQVLAEILAKRPDFIWVGLGTPKQYAWINRIKPRLDHGIMLAVGFAFDVNAGMKPDAPAWMQRCGLTWLYRLATEPRRLAGRYLKWNTLFLFYMGGEAMGPLAQKLKGSRIWMILSNQGRRCKLTIRDFGLKVVDLFASDVRDCKTGKLLGRGLLVGWRGHPRMIGYEGLPPLIPRFLPQKRLTYWRQSVGFTTHERPDFPRLAGVTSADSSSSRVMNVVLAHRGGRATSSLLAQWEDVSRPENLWIAFGGSQEDFELIDYSRKVFVEDAGLRRGDNQREKQSYTGIFQSMAPVIERERPDYIYFCEYDHIPLRSDLNALQVAEITSEGADVMGHWLYRVDGTSHYHMLYHQSDPAFLPYWQSISLREEKGVVLSMFGSGSLWTREAFQAIASRAQQIPCYLELYLPTLAHHLGYRVRCWDESRHMISNLPSRKITIDEASKRNCMTIHPVK